MKQLRGFLTAGALALGAAVVPHSASAITVSGVNFDPGPTFMFSNILENQPLAVGDVLNGYGIITQIDAALQATFCPGCELTFTFGGFTVANLGDGNDFVFTGGTVNIYADSSPNFDPTNPATAGADAGTTLWLQLAGDLFTDGGAGAPGTLIARDVQFVAGGSSNFGQARFDVVGGAAAPFFNTNSVVSGQIIDGISDMTFTSSFQLANAPINPAFPIQGTGELQGLVQSVPEPGTLALLGISMLGFAPLVRIGRKA